MQSTTASVERSLSAMKMVKNYLRATMGQERLSNLAIFHVHKDFVFDFHNATEFISKKTNLGV